MERIKKLLGIKDRTYARHVFIALCIYLASGRYDVYVHGGQKLWDYAAGALIFEEAGGNLSTLEGDDFWSGEHVFKRSVIAALQPALFERWEKWIRENQ